MTHLVFKRVFPALVAVSLSLCSWQALAQQNPVPIQPGQSGITVQTMQLSTPTYMPTSNAQGLRMELSPLHHGSAGSGLPRGLRFPGDLQYHGGPVIATAQQHTLFFDVTAACPYDAAACWGDPVTFLANLSASTNLSHITDQYVGSTANNRYPLGIQYEASGFNPIFGGTKFTDADMANIADLAAQLQTIITGVSGFGVGHVYHIFLTPGTDECFDTTYSVCYSPDNPATFFFCGYHSSAVDPVNGTVVYTVEPYENVPGCAVGPVTPNGTLADSTNNVLSHEWTETITDPINGSGWNNTNDNGLYGQEIGDECSFLAYNSLGQITGFGPSYVKLNNVAYAVQPEYSNKQHACATSPFDE